MRRKILLIGLMIACAMGVHAEFITLKNGQTVQGQILVDNSDVLIIKDKNGARFQYPRTEVVSVSSSNPAVAASTEKAASKDGDKKQETGNKKQETKVKKQETGIKNTTTYTGGEAPKKTSFRLELAGGAGTEPSQRWGGAASADLLLGSKQIAGKEILLGGQIGYHGYFFPTVQNDKKTVATLHFLPIALALRGALMPGTHAPELGMSIGYGIALDKKYLGGIYVGLDAGYRYRISTNNAFYMGAYLQFQQAEISTTETINDVDADDNPFATQYTNKTGRSLVNIGMKIGLSF